MSPLAATLVLFVAPQSQKPHVSDAFFHPSGPVLTIRIEVDKENVAKLREKPREYVPATLKVGKETWKNVGLHLKGAAGSFRDWYDRPALTINCDKLDNKLVFHGLDKFHLNNSVQDLSYLNEIISGELFRAIGVPTARGTHAFVELNGRKVGLYGLKEGYDKAFLEHHFKNVNGNLYDGGFLQDLDQNLKLDSGPGCEWKDVRALAAAARTRDPAERLAALENKLDLDKFISMWAMEVMLVDWDGYCRNRNNYRMYCDPATGKFTFFAHGKDQLFQSANDPLVHGWAGLVARRIWETEEGKKRYYQKMKDILEKQFNYEEIAKRIDAWSKRLKDPLNEYQKGFGDQYLELVKHHKRAIKARIDYMNKEVPKLK